MVLLLFINLLTRSGEGIIGMHFVRPSVTFRFRPVTYVRIDGLRSKLVQMLSSFRRHAVTLTLINTSRSLYCLSLEAPVRRPRTAFL